MIFSRTSRLAVSLAVAISVPIAALVWLGARVLQQDRDIERQRRRERLEVAADRLALDIERRVQDIEEQLAKGQGIRVTAAGLESDGRWTVLYQPALVSSGDQRSDDAGFAAAESQEFQHHNLAAAVASYRALAVKAAPAIRARALVALGRVLRQQDRTDEALRAYDDLATLHAVSVAGQPAALIALQGRCKVFEQRSDTAALQTAAGALVHALNSGSWPIDRPTFELYRQLADGWGASPTPAADLVRTEAAIRIWEAWRDGDLPSRGQRVVRAEQGSALVIWTTDLQSTRIAPIAGDAADELLASSQPQLQARAYDTDGTPLFGSAAVAGDSLSLTPDHTKLPFVIRVSIDRGWIDGADRSRRAMLFAGLGGVLLLMIAAGYGLYHVTTRELTLARQQSDFVSAVSHEFRTPLTSMRHLTDLLVSRGVASEDRRAYYYQLLSHETERLYRMVETLLSFGRIEARAYAFRMDELDAATLVRSVVEEFQGEPVARQRLIECDAPDGLPPVEADRETLSRAIWNLIENAAKYSAPGEPIHVCARCQDGLLRIDVVDRGFGIPPAEQRIVFQKFVRGAEAKRKGVRGVGIGLALVQRIAEAHGGGVSVKSEPGRGSTFTLEIPLAAGAVPRAARPAAPERVGALAEARSLKPEV